ncbi:HIRAN domain-containing protein [Arthrobacter sp.]|uniref:HIRAN domain-containing protein n=1 Tax=Arthrobacter sp. TaxID=1667 RepID=UPI0028998161|nr:HIRAN domain-containing protein [Arthrobacter sp.]
MTTASPPVPAAWHPDPSGRNQYRYWDGVTWTDWIANDGVQGTDPLLPPAAPAAAQRRSTATEPLTSKKEPEREKATRNGYLLLGADGYPNTEVAGEFARMDAIHKAIGRKPKKDEEIERSDLIAALVPEPTNPHDKNAVMVQINDQHVGYLEKEVAAVYVSAIRDVWDSGHVAATGARIWASARESWDSSRKLKYVARVSIALNEPHLVLPMNEPPAGAYSILPWGSALQVTGEEQHQDVLADFTTNVGDGIALGTLAVIEGGTARAPKTLIEIRLDGERVGQLTPASSQHFVPTVRHLESQGQDAAAWIRVKGSAIAAQATVQAAKAHELPTDWFAEPNTIPALRRSTRPTGI